MWDLRSQGASDLLNMAAAGMASSAMLLRRDRPQLAAQLVQKARRFRQIAIDVPGERSEAPPQHAVRCTSKS